MITEAFHSEQVRRGERYEFGANWARFLSVVDQHRIDEAVRALSAMLGVSDLTGLRFLDIGSGSGLSSLAARRLGASVVSFDFDPESVACTRELRRRYYPDDANWQVTEGSVLDTQFMESLGKFDIVYSWGVLHHTGHMWDALETAGRAVAPRGYLFVALYNDQGLTSKAWRIVKKSYNHLNQLHPVLARPILLCSLLRLWGPTTIKDVLKGRPGHSWRNYFQSRGMAPWVDLEDWVGGYPFEVASPAEVVAFHSKRGFTQVRSKLAAGRGCSEFVFNKVQP